MQMAEPRDPPKCQEAGDRGHVVTLGMNVYWQWVTWPSCLLLNLPEHSLPCWGAWSQVCGTPCLYPVPISLEAFSRPKLQSSHQCSRTPLGRKGSPAGPPAPAFLLGSCWSSAAVLLTQGTPLFSASVWGGISKKTQAKCAARCPPAAERLCAYGWHSTLPGHRLLGWAGDSLEDVLTTVTNADPNS